MTIDADHRTSADRAGASLGRTAFYGGNATLTPCDDGTTLFKEFADAFRTNVDSDALARLVSWRQDLSESDRDELDGFTAWPRSVVRDGETASGLIIPKAPMAFMLDGWSAPAPAARTLATLVRPGGGAPPPVPRILGTIGLVVGKMLWLHRHGVIVNDVQPENILVNEDGSRVFLVDCDAMAGASWGSVAGPAAPEYLRDVLADPFDQSPGTDFAKLAWCLIFLTLDDFAIRTLGDHELARLHNFLPRSTVDLVLAGRDPGNHSPHRIRDWQAAASMWIRAARYDLVLTDRGLRFWRAEPRPPVAVTGGPEEAGNGGRARVPLEGVDPAPAGSTGAPLAPYAHGPSPGRSLALAVVVLLSIIAAVLLIWLVL